MCTTAPDKFAFVPEEVEQAKQSVVQIAANVYRDGQWYYPRAMGFSFSEERYIITAAHVLEDEDNNLPETYRIAVYLPDCSIQMAEVVYVRQGSPITEMDILVLRIPDPPPPINTSPLAVSQMDGSNVFLITDALSQVSRLRSGVVEEALFFNDTDQEENIQKTGLFPYIYASTITQYGNSGAPLFDADMRAVGMIVGKGQETGATYALHLSLIKDRLRELGLL